MSGGGLGQGGGCVGSSLRQEWVEAAGGLRKDRWDALGEG